MAQAEQGLRSLESDLAVRERALLEAQAHVARMEEKALQLSSIQQERDSHAQAVARHQGDFRWPEYLPGQPEEAERHRQAASELSRAIERDEAELKGITETVKKLAEDHKRYEAALTGLRMDHNRILGQQAARRGQLTVFKSEEDLSRSEQELLQLQESLTAQLGAILQRHETAASAERSLALKQVELQEKQNSAAAQQARLSVEWESLKEAIANKLREGGYSSLDTVKAALAEAVDWEADLRAVAAYLQELNTAQAVLATLQSDSTAPQYDAVAHDAAEEKLLQLKAEIETHQGEWSLLRSALEKLKADREKRIVLERTQSQQRGRLENLEVLRGLFRASGFVQYVSTLSLQELIQRADVRFRTLTRNALSLELGDKSDFLVRDMLNGGETRSVKTLSGGQTFQASLCLALALADTVPSLSGSKNNFFFLDEGFGTLDKDSLSVVFDTLKQLRQENRIVGLISHVDEMQQEIDVFLRVSQTEERGSQVVGSWCVEA
jgi:exonuclease SbcC